MVKRKSEDRRQTSALKHGAFATELLISKEDEDEFNQLHNGLVEDFKPSGRMEEELVVDLAKLHWRKRRVEQFYAYEENWARAHPGEYGIDMLANIETGLMKGVCCHDAWASIRKLPVPMFEAIKKLIKPPTKEIDDDWIELFKKVTEYVSLKAQDEFSRHRQGLPFLGEMGAKLMDLSAKHIAIEERLDAMIDRTFKRLAQVKAFKDVIAVNNNEKKPRKISVA